MEAERGEPVVKRRAKQPVAKPNIIIYRRTWGAGLKQFSLLSSWTRA
jgi:hypothetical protein